MSLTVGNKEIDINFILKNKKKIVNIIVITVGIVVALNIYNGQKKTTLAYRNKLEQEKNKNALLKELVILENKINDYKKILNLKDNSEVISRITKIAEESGLKILTVKPAPLEETPLYTKTKIRFLMEAEDYHSIGKFVARLEKDEDLYKIEFLFIKPAKRSGVQVIGLEKETEPDTVLNLEILIIKFAFKG